MTPTAVHCSGPLGNDSLIAARPSCVGRFTVTWPPPPSTALPVGHVAIAVNVVLLTAFTAVDTVAEETSWEAEGPGGPMVPAGPGGPSGPAGPVRPVAPGAPDGPAGSAGPAAPAIPATPGGPAAPVSPFGPAGPGSPLAAACPGCPVGPGGPTVPAGPAGPRSPLRLQLTGRVPRAAVSRAELEVPARGRRSSEFDASANTRLLRRRRVAESHHRKDQKDGHAADRCDPTEAHRGLLPRDYPPGRIRGSTFR